MLDKAIDITDATRRFGIISTYFSEKKSFGNEETKRFHIN
jgi:hypothetical protein